MMVNKGKRKRKTPQDRIRASIVDLEDLPRGLPLETPLVPPNKRRGVLTRSQLKQSVTMVQAVKPAADAHLPSPAVSQCEPSVTVVQAVKLEAADAHLPSPAISQCEPSATVVQAVKLEAADAHLSSPAISQCEPSATVVQAVKLEAADAHLSSPAMSVNITASSSPTSTPTISSNPTTSSASRQSTVLSRQALSGQQIDDALIRRMRLGSEDESEVSDQEDDSVGCVRVPRQTQLLMDTPVDTALETTLFSRPLPEAASAAAAVAASASPDSDTTDASSSAAASSSINFKPNNFLEFEWRPFPETPTPPELRRETFSQSNGATTPLYDPYELFIAIWDKEFLSQIVTETNRYAEQTVARMMAQNSLRPSSRICEWVDTNGDELYTFFGIVIAMGVVIKSQIVEYWNVTKHIFATPGFRVHMSIRRFQLLCSMLHFNNNEDLCTRNLDATQAKLFKVQPLLDHLNQRFSDLYLLRQNIALDESLLLWKGGLDINQFIPNKAATVGIKSYELCESQTGYLWRFEIYAHQRHDDVLNASLPVQLQGSTATLVLRLLDGLEFRGHTIWMDNFYNSPALARKLKSIGFDCVGTLRTNRQLVPAELSDMTKSSMRPGQLSGFTSGDVDVMVWRDQNRVAMISTYHGNAVSADNGVLKPILIRDYNICMGGVDKKDQMLAMYPVERKGNKVWYKKIFRRLLNVSVLNSFIIHKQSSAVTKLSHRNFRMQLVHKLLHRHSTPHTPSVSKPVTFKDAKFHCPAEHPFLPNGSTRLRRVCVVCKSRVATFCNGCDKSVCLFKCWRTLHTDDGPK